MTSPSQHLKNEWKIGLLPLVICRKLGVPSIKAFHNCNWRPINISSLISIVANQYLGDIFVLFTLCKHYKACTCMCTCEYNLLDFSDSKGRGICDLQNKLHLNRHYLNSSLEVNLQNQLYSATEIRASHDECQTVR